jgi:hypothetical protein
VPAAIVVFASAPIESLSRDTHLWPLALVPPAPLAHFYKSKLGLTRGWYLAALGTVFKDLSRLAPLALLALLLAKERARAPWIRLSAIVAALAGWWLIRRPSFAAPLPTLSLSMSLAFAVALLALFSRRLEGRAFLFALGIFAGLAAARTAFSGGSFGHYEAPNRLVTALTTVTFAVVFLPGLLLGTSRGTSYLRRLIALVLFVTSAWFSIGAVQALRAPEKIEVATREGSVFLTPAKAELFHAVSRHSAAGERALMIPESFAIDALFQLRNVSPLIQSVPGLLDERGERRIISQMEASPPDLIIWLDRPVEEFGSKPFGEGYGFLLADWCERRYEVVDASPAGRILRRR